MAKEAPESKDLPPPPEPIPTTTAVAADVAADEAGEPRPKAESTPPPGTDRPSFWQAGPTKSALSTSFGILVWAIVALINWAYTGAIPSQDALIVIVVALLWSWGTAFGLKKTDADALIWK